MDSTRAAKRVVRLDAFTVIKEGDTITGVVTQVEHFGVFAECGESRVLVMIPEMSESPIRRPSEIVRIGQELSIRITGQNALNGVFIGSLKGVVRGGTSADH